MISGLVLYPLLKPSTGIGRGKGKRGTKAAPAQPQAPSIPQAQTIEEANTLAVQLGVAKQADFTGLDISVANEMIAQIAEARRIYPGLQELDAVGAWVPVMRILFGGDRRVFKDTNGAAFMSIGSSNRIALGVGLKLFQQSEIKETLQTLRDCVDSTWSPVGCGTVKSIIDHEIGHWIDHSANISGKTRIKKLFRQYHERSEDFYTLPSGRQVYGSQRMGSVLSRYANKNTKEFIAEAWAEYRNNPNPRPVAKEVGDLIMSVIRR